MLEARWIHQAIDFIGDLVASTGIEPVLSALRGRRVNQLHHDATEEWPSRDGSHSVSISRLCGTGKACGRTARGLLEPQISPLRCAPVEMTTLNLFRRLYTELLHFGIHIPSFLTSSL